MFVMKFEVRVLNGFLYDCGRIAVQKPERYAAGVCQECAAGVYGAVCSESSRSGM